ncbi:glycoside hydrolase superfamily [Phellopilus nigrolimitatus]|nr:glycoside hydrolase superfamily [Phellopilus nigrolimitatus]
MLSSFWFLVSLLAVAQAVPSCPGGGCLPHASASQDRLQKRQALDLFSETQTETLTETFTTTEGTQSLSAASSSATLQPKIDLLGDVSVISDAQSVLFLPFDTTSSVLPVGTATSSGEGSDYPSSSVASETVVSSTTTNPTAPAVALQTPVIKGPLISAYYPDWAASVLPPEKIDMTRIDWIDFAFVVPDCKIQSGTKVKLSIGGWDGSKFFSEACASATSRQTFVGNIVALYKQFNLDGIDFDWEYPGQQGEGSNNVSPQDSGDFLAMLKLLRISLPQAARITAAVQDVPFADTTGNPLKDVSAFAAVLDWVNIMNYDVFSSSSPPVRLMLGVPAYGYVNPSHATTLVHKRSLPPSALFARQNQDQSVAQSVAGVVTVKSEDGTTNSGQVQFNELVAQGALLSALVAGSPTFVGYGGFTRFWDSCSSTPFLTSPYVNQVITYDDPQSLYAKGAFAKQAKILGTVMWDLSGDTAQWDLTNALRRGLGKPA